MSEVELQESAEFAHDVIKEEMEGEEKPEWVGWTAISAMIMALFSAIGALLAGISANEALLARTEEIAELSIRNRDQIRMDLVKQNQLFAEMLGKNAGSSADSKIKEFNKQIEAMTKETQEDEAEVVKAMKTHEILAIGVTILSIAITLCGLAIVSLNKFVWHFGLTFGIAGVGFVSYGIMTMF